MSNNNNITLEEKITEILNQYTYYDDGLRTRMWKESYYYCTFIRDICKLIEENYISKEHLNSLISNTFSTMETIFKSIK